MATSSSQSNRVYLPELGIVNSLGCGKDEVLASLMAGSQDGILSRDDLIEGRSVMVGAVQADLPEVPSELSRRYNTRSNRLILSAYSQIEDSVQSAIARFGHDRVAIVLGISTSGIAEGEVALEEFLKGGSFPAEYSYEMQEMGSPPRFLAEYLGLTCWTYAVSTACSSSAKAFASARSLLEMDQCDAVIVGGVDSLCRLTVNGFASLEAVSAGITNPFSRNRDGITIGEGAALFLMVRDPAEIALCGVGESSDASHITAPHPEGTGAKSAMCMALKDAGLAPEDIDYINLHGTGTPANDLIESAAVHEIFGSETPCSSTKPLTGHTLGAAGGTEAAFCWLAMSGMNSQMALPPHIWDGCADDELKGLSLVDRGSTYEDRGAGYALSNSFAFGGNNVCMILGRSGE